MSQQALADFITTVSSDEALFTSFGAATGDLEGDAAYAAVADFASTRGFDVSPADAQAFYASLTAGQDELSDDALEDVAGGTGGGLSGIMSRIVSAVNAAPVLIAQVSNCGPVAPIGPIPLKW